MLLGKMFVIVSDADSFDIEIFGNLYQLTGLQELDSYISYSAYCKCHYCNKQQCQQYGVIMVMANLTWTYSLKRPSHAILMFVMYDRSNTVCTQGLL